MKVVAMASYDNGWSNVELIKDCGIIPYLLQTEYGYEVEMVGAKRGDYPYHELYTKEVNMVFLSVGDTTDKVKYMEEHAKDCVLLIIRGCYENSFPIVECYKRLNPTGKVYVGLDANSWWMDRIRWDAKEFKKFMDNCDVIATSCRAMQEHLNAKWPWIIEHIPNGYYDFTKQWKKPNFEQKENIILTVGRLGTKQKATEVLMEAYAKVASQMPGWKLRLVGNMEQAFNQYVEDYFLRFPKLRERIEFAGAILDRKKLMDEYSRAKIFALPSELEGGTPNVIAEALHCGCVTAVTKFDAYEEATDYGRCGRYCEVGDADGFGNLLYRLCISEELKQLSEAAYKYAEKHFDMIKIVARIKELVFGEEYE